MAILARAALSLSLSALAFGQRALLPGGYGRAPYRGPVATPPNSPGMQALKFSRSPERQHPSGNRNNPTVVIVPFATYGYGDPGPQEVAPSVGLPAVAPPDVAPPMPTYESSPPPQGIPCMAPYNPDEGTQTCLDARAEPPPPLIVREVRPTIYLIALKSHTIVQALGYWVEGSTLHYISSTFGLNQVSLSLVDREFSQRLNDERGLEFKLTATKSGPPISPIRAPQFFAFRSLFLEAA
ncbi:MAG TPA: hypothetical protein VH639_21435 [Bryobacteraceae bacterium]|jgi:hypothetical protein